MKKSSIGKLILEIVGILALAFLVLFVISMVKDRVTTRHPTTTIAIATTSTEPTLEKMVATLPTEPTGTNAEMAAAYIAVCQDGLDEKDRDIITKVGYYSYFGEDVNHLLDLRDGYSLGDLTTMYFPVLYRNEENKVSIWYCDKYGRLVTGNSIGEADLEIQVSGRDYNSYVYLMRAPSEHIIYFEQKGVIESWSFGKLVSSYNVPANSIYCGHSFFEGHIFLSGNDVYAFERLNEDPEPVAIAHNVQNVIVADYSQGSDPWSQPLFLMKDGTVKAYIGWEEEYPVDSPQQLEGIRENGGYYKVYLPAD